MKTRRSKGKGGQVGHQRRVFSDNDGIIVVRACMETDALRVAMYWGNELISGSTGRHASQYNKQEVCVFREGKVG